MKSFLFYTTYFLLFFSYLSAASPWHFSLLRTSCKKQIEETISKLVPSAQWTSKGVAEEGTEIYQTPTRVIGNWLEIHLLNNGEVFLYRNSPHTKTKYTWEKDHCVPKIASITEHYDKDRMKAAFNDEKLYKLLESSKTGVIYAWSPHMPYSLNGIKTIKEVAVKLGITLTFILDPNADEQIALKEGRKRHLTEHNYQRIESVELLNRGMTMHFPSLIIYSKGAIVGPLLPGVKSKEIYETFIKEQLAP